MAARRARLPGRSCDLIGGLIFSGHFRGSSFENTGTGFLHGCPKHADLLLARKQQIGMSWAARTCWHPLLSALSTLPCSLSREHPARKGRVSDTRRTISPTRWCHHQDEASPWRLSPLGAHERECTENGKSTTGMCKKKRDHLWLPIEDALASSPYHLRPGPSSRESVNRHKAKRKEEPHAGNEHLTAPFAVSTREEQRPPAPLPASTSADLRVRSSSAVGSCGAGRFEHWILPLRLDAKDNTLGAPLEVTDTGKIVSQAPRVGDASWNGTIEGGSWRYSSHGVAGGCQERQTEQRSDQQSDT